MKPRWLRFLRPGILPEERMELKHEERTVGDVVHMPARLRAVETDHGWYVHADYDDEDDAS